MTPILEVRGLTVQFGGVTAVNDVNFDVDAGQILGVIGPNGAGKTTMFDAISGFVPSRGTVRLDGETISGSAPEARSRHGLGRSFQDARLFPSLTVSETLAVAFERHVKAQDVVSTALRMPWVRRAEADIAAKVDDLIELMGLVAFRDKFVSELSTGSRRIVDLAVIMAHQPKVLLLDEPSSGIAQKETEALGPVLKRLRDTTGTTLIVVEHDMPLIQSISDELLALETGALLTRGAPRTVLDDPRLVEAYLGTDQSVVARSGAVAAATAEKRTPRKRAATKKTPASGSAPAKKRTSTAKKAATKKAAASRKVAAAKKSAAAAKTSSTTKATAKRSAASKKAPAKKKAPARGSNEGSTARKKAGPAKRSAAKGTTSRKSR